MLYVVVTVCVCWMPQFKPKVLSSENSQSDEAGYMTKDELKKLCECDLFCDGTFLLYSTGNQSKHTRAHIINSARNINKYYRVTGEREKPPQIESQRHQKYRFQCIWVCLRFVCLVKSAHERSQWKVCMWCVLLGHSPNIHSRIIDFSARKPHNLCYYNYQCQLMLDECVCVFAFVAIYDDNRQFVSYVDLVWRLKVSSTSFPILQPLLLHHLPRLRSFHASHQPQAIHIQEVKYLIHQCDT